MEILKKLIGVICIAVAIGAEYWLVSNLNLPAASNPFGKTPDAINIAKWILIPVSIPVVLGALLCFGYYALSNEYEGSHE
jgi:hypothetical protein